MYLNLASCFLKFRQFREEFKEFHDLRRIFERILTRQIHGISYKYPRRNSSKFINKINAHLISTLIYKKNVDFTYMQQKHHFRVTF